MGTTSGERLPERCRARGTRRLTARSPRGPPQALAGPRRPQCHRYRGRRKSIKLDVVGETRPSDGVSRHADPGRSLRARACGLRAAGHAWRARARAALLGEQDPLVDSGSWKSPGRRWSLPGPVLLGPLPGRARPPWDSSSRSRETSPGPRPSSRSPSRASSGSWRRTGANPSSSSGLPTACSCWAGFRRKGRTPPCPEQPPTGSLGDRDGPQHPERQRRGPSPRADRAADRR